MVRMNAKDRAEYGRKQVLYDEPLLSHLVEEHGNAIDIKEAIKTSAHTYEIRTAIEYWFGGQNNHRTSDAIWMRCKAVDDGHWTLVGDEFKYADEVSA